MTSARTPEATQHRSIRLYERLLRLYPADFRNEYGEELVQTFHDLVVFSSRGGARSAWSRTLGDLVVSATKERAANLRPSAPDPGRRRSAAEAWAVGFAIVAVCALLTLVAALGGAGIIWVAPAVALVALPVVALTRFRRAWIIRRTTGGQIASTVGGGVLALATAAGALTALGQDAGYFVFIGVAGGLIVGSILAAVWAISTIVQRPNTSHPVLGAVSWDGAHGSAPGTGVVACPPPTPSQPPPPEPPLSRARPIAALVVSILILGAIAAGSYNSYQQSLGPAGDHSVANASADTRALWEAAGAGNVDEVRRLTTETCADPWVKFPVGNGRHNAKGYAENAVLALPDAEEPPYQAIADHLGDYMDTWTADCRR